MRTLLLALLLVLCADGSAAGVDDIFEAGETLDFNLHWTRISGGSARMTIAPLGGERYRITSIGRSSAFFSRFFKVRDEIESIVTRDTFSTLQYHKILDERGRKKDELTVVDREKRLATRKEKEIEVPSRVFDPLSLIYYIRLLDLVPGTSHEFAVIADGKVYVVHANVTGRETLTTPAGKFPCVIVEPRMATRAGVFRDDQNRLQIWYSDDERRLPVRIRSDVNVGSITATLRGKTKGVDGTEPVTERGQSSEDRWPPRAKSVKITPRGLRGLPCGVVHSPISTLQKSRRVRAFHAMPPEARIQSCPIGVSDSV